MRYKSWVQGLVTCFILATATPCAAETPSTEFQSRGKIIGGSVAMAYGVFGTVMGVFVAQGADLTLPGCSGLDCDTVEASNAADLQLRQFAVGIGSVALGLASTAVGAVLVLDGSEEVPVAVGIRAQAIGTGGGVVVVGGF